MEPASFLALLKFLYSDEVQIDPETVMTTLYTAKKYAVPALEKHCVDFLKRHLCADNAFMLLTQARLFDEPQLAALCLETIDKNTPEALAAEGKCLLVCLFHLGFEHLGLHSTPGPWLLQISVMQFYSYSFSKNRPNIQLMRFSLHK